MKRVILILALLLSITKVSLCQSSETQFVIVNIQPNALLVNGDHPRIMQIINEKDSIEWIDRASSIRIMPLNDYVYTDSTGVQRTWYEGVVYGITPSGSQRMKNNLFWWIKYNKSSAKGIEFSFDQDFYMLHDTLIIERPQILGKYEVFEFISIDNGKSFFAVNDNTKPLIYITKEMLEAVGFDGKTINFKVVFHDKFDDITIANLMRIYYIK